MRITLSMTAFLVLGACSSGSAPPPSTPRASDFLPVTALLPPEPSRGSAWAEVDARAPAEPVPVRGGRFDTERQIAALRRAAELYEQFLERAAGRPELASAVEKSRQRLADARETIVFLERSRQVEATPP